MPPSRSAMSSTLYPTPSKMARIMSARLWLRPRPKKTARAFESQTGARSPSRYGRKVRPAAPGGASIASATIVS